MADLFLARERTVVGVDRLVVLKRLRLKYVNDPDFLAMFLDECRLALRLEHPRIVRAYAVDEWEGGASLVLEHLQGCDAGTLMTSGIGGDQLGLEAALTIGHAVADALAYAHQLTDGAGRPLEVVHRDVSPANIFLCRDGSVKLIDFGVAAISRPERRTPKGVLKGKVSYMSPEQCRDDPMDGRSDLFSLGVVLYELATGRRLFPGHRAVEIVHRIMEDPITPPSAFDADFPADLEALLVRLLDKDPDRRPACAAEVRDSLVAVSQRLGFTLAGFGLTGVVHELSPAPVTSRREPSDTLPDPAAGSSGAVTVADQRLEQPVVLVVDDEESFHRITRNRLHRCRRIAAYNALQALDAIATHSVDVVILDLNLPDRNGLEIIEELRMLGHDVAVIVCSADSDVGVAVECMKRGAFDYLVKTRESFDALSSRVESALRRRGSQVSGAR